MRGSLLTATVGVAALLVSACAERSVSGPADRPLHDFTNGPQAPGPIVFRVQGDFRISYSDPVRGLTAIHGGDVVEFCKTGETNFELADIQMVFPPQDVDRILLLLRSRDVPTTVWPFGSFDCDLFTTLSPIATGTVDFTQTDNDLIAFLRDHNNHNAFGFVAQGNLTRSNGRRAAFNGVSRCVWDGKDFGTLTCNDRINVQ